MVSYRFDLYPRTDPKDGTLIHSFLPELTGNVLTGGLQKAAYRAEANGTSTGQLAVRSTSEGGQAIDPLGLQYIRVIELPGGSVRGGFFLEKGKFSALSEDEDSLLTFSGAGTLSYLSRASMAPHTYISPIFEGQDPFDDMWRLGAQSTVFANGDYVGAELWRVIYEATHFIPGTHRHADGQTYTDTHDDDRPENPLPGLTMTFDQWEDSSGNPWTLRAPDMKAQVGENVLSVVKRLMEAGLYVELDPDTFELNAWEQDVHRAMLDATGVAWATDVVRFQSPTDPDDITTGNIKDDAARNIEAYIKRSALWAGSGDVYGLSTSPSDIPWEGHYRAAVTDTAALEAIADVQLAAIAEAGDTLKLRLWMEDDPANGKYLPWDHVLLDQQVTVHTGTDQWEFDERTFPVAALTVELKPGGNWDCIVELGASYSAAASRSFQVQGTPSHSHPLPELCRAGSIVDTEAVINRLYTTNRGTNVSPYADYPASVAHDTSVWDAAGSGTGWDVVLVPTVPDLGNANHTSVAGGAAAGRDCFYGSFYRKLTGSGTIEGYFRGFALCDAASGIGVPDGLQDMVTQVVVRVYRPGTASIIGTPYAGHSMSASGAHKWRTTGLRNQAFPPISEWDDPALGVALTPVNYQDGDFLIIEVGSRNFTPTGEVSGGTIRHTANQSTDLPENETETAVLNSWFQITVAGESSFSTDSDGNIHLIGSGKRYKRCSDTEHYFTDRDPDSTDDWATGGWRDGTHWVNTSTGATFMLIDKDTGNWLQLTQGPEHGHSAEETSYDNSDSGLTAENVKAAIDEIVATGGGLHASAHEDGGADEIEIANLATSETGTSKVLKPDGSGGVVWGTDATGGGGGGGSSIPSLLDSVKGSADTPDDDFPGTSLNVKWTAADGTAGTIALLGGTGSLYQVGLIDSWLHMLIGTASGDSVELRQDYTLPDGKCIIAPIWIGPDNAGSSGSISNNEFQCGIGINSTDSGILAGTAATTGYLTFDAQASGSVRVIYYDGSTVIGTTADTPGYTRAVFLRIDRVGLVYHAFWAPITGGYPAWEYLGGKTLSAAANNIWLFGAAGATSANRINVAVPWFRQGTALAINPF